MFNLQSSTIIMPFLQGYVYPVEDLQPLLDLLKEWNLECTYQTLLGNIIIQFYCNSNHNY